MKASKILLLIAASLTLSGCYMKGSVEDLTGVTVKSVQGQQQGLSSGATANEIVNGYRVSTSLGSYSDGIQQTQNGYVIYSGLQGSTSAEVIQTDE